MVYGWGRKTREWAMPDGRMVVCSYSYVSLAFIFTLVWKRRWMLIGRDRAMDQETTRAELEQIYGAGNVPDIGFLQRFGMLIAGAGIVALALAFAGWAALSSALGLGSSDTTAAGPVAEVITSDRTLGANADSGLGGDKTDDADDPDEEAADDSPSATTDTTIGSADDQTATTENGTETEAEDQGGASGQFFEEASMMPSTQPGLVSTNVDRPLQGWSEATVHRAYATDSIEDTSAPAGEKFVVVEYQLLGVESTANLLDNAFRLIDGDQRYSPVAPNINTVISGGEVINDRVIFSVPRSVNDLTLEIGTLDPAADGYQSSFDFVLSAASAPAEPERYGGPDLAGQVNLLTDGNLMSGTPHNLNANWSPMEVQVLEATMTAKFGPDGARPGFKFVVVDVEVMATGPYGLWQAPSFRVEADGELYGHNVYVNQSLSTGETARASIPFEVPVSTTSLRFEAGVPESFETGERAEFEINFD